MEYSLVENVDGKLVVSSRDVAENFKKRHADVLEKIKTLSAEIQPTEKSVGYFIPTEYCDNKGENRPEYLLTRDGFSLLVMGFTDKEALDWKLKYIEAFNKMETALMSQNTKRLPIMYQNGINWKVAV